ncbi:L-seryl-tRNA(Sec) selenium transferase [Hyphomicrobium sp.]|uniref:L-seryl-tRNA(Sec) selenium transferase n=1 Tax=Hyphomicrobium sp. TaxID=82 RepID=UPI002FE13683
MNQNCPGQMKRLPSVDRVLQTDLGKVACERFGHAATVEAIRRALARIRDAGDDAHEPCDAAAIAREASAHLESEGRPSVRRVFNLTGTVLHTNLGRAVLPESAIAAAVDAMRFPVALEFDVEGGARGERDDHVRGLIRELTGAEDAAIVNNNAGAVLLVLNTFGAGKEAIVSRGELIEIGGAFRLPDIMTRAGARLVEVGTTNRTHLSDYEGAITADTGLILKAHTSNFVIQGFTKSVPTAELAALATLRGLPLIHDLGSGALVDLTRFGLAPEPTVREALAEGAGLVTFSGDKLLGGPQAGVIAGARALVERVAKNPLKRALRMDKIRLAALEAVLKLYRDPDRLAAHLPTARFFARTKAEIAAVGARLRDAVAAAVGEDYAVSLAECASQIGSGALPLETLASSGLAIRPRERKDAGRRLALLATALRRLPIPVVGRIADGALILDMRCMEDEPGFVAQLPALRSAAPPDFGDEAP